MSIFEHGNYDQDYQTYLDWKDKQSELDKEYDLAEEYERDLQEEMREAETTGERCVREAQEEDVRQLAQVTVGGVYRYELEWLPETGEVRVEVDQFPDGSPLYLWYPDYMGTTEVLSKLMNIPEEKIRITGLAFFTKGDMLVALNYERRQFMNNMWRDYAADGTAMQFNVEIVCPNNCYDASCDGTNCEFKPLLPHGFDGTQCDCSDCTLDYGLCSCGCGGNHQAHAEWLEEREKEKQAFVHETAKPEPTPAVEDDAESTSSVESAEEKESRLWSDFKLAIMVAMTALMMGAYICKVACF
jgi:hypothetical protein